MKRFSPSRFELKTMREGLGRAMDADMRSSMLTAIDDQKEEYAQCQQRRAQAENALEPLVLAHPEWFTEGRKSITTPYGTVKLTASTSLLVKNEEATIVLIEGQGAEAAARFLRTAQTLNLEALEKLSDAELKPLRIVRLQKQNFKVEPAKVKMGRAGKTAEAGEEGKK